MHENLMPLVDQLGYLSAEIANLELRQKQLEDELKAIGAGAYEGALFRATVSVADRKTLDMKAVRKKLSKQFIAAHTKTKEVMSVHVVARTGEVEIVNQVAKAA